ncbi:MAG: universal stress protein [Thermodesulfobacteriota bacterium]|jgi:nucleotide-binding universal stress UspA family protein
MKNIILILSVSGTSDEALEFAIKKAKEESAKLTALYVLDTGLTDEVFDRFTDIGFIGDKPSTQLTEAIIKEYRQRGYEELGKVQIRVMEEGLEFNPMMVNGNFLECVLNVIKKQEADMVIAVRRKRSAFKRYFSQSVVDDLKEKAPCEVVMFEVE